MAASFLRLPVFKVLLPFLLGILTVIGGFINPAFPYWEIGIVAFLGFLAFSWLANINIKWFWLPGIWLMLFFYFLGIQLTLNQKAIEDPTHFSKHATDSSHLIIRVMAPIDAKENSVHIEGKVKTIVDQEQKNQVKGRVWAYLPLNAKTLTIQYGDLLYCSNEFSTLKPPPNPEQFNLKAFLANQQIYHQAFLNQNDWDFTGYEQTNFVYQNIYKFKSQAKIWLKNAITRSEELDVAKALVLGEKTGLDPELRQSYASTGAMHVLAVSGLHVGIIYMILNYAFGFLNFLPKGRILKITIIILILWFYALLTGLSPSVFRAATMFTFVTIGQNIRRYTNVFSSIMISMLILLAYDPFLITQVGFQLSYAAVIGIILLQPRIYNLLPQSRYWLIDQIWAITAVSIAAQIATFPITLFYFNQFPTYFLVSNLVVIPAAFLIVTTGFCFLIIHVLNLTILEQGIDPLLDWQLWGLNKSIFWVQDLPMSLIDEVFLSTTAIAFLYGTLIAAIIAFTQRSKLALFLTVGMLTGLLAHQGIQKWEQMQQSKLAIFKAGQETLLSAVGTDRAIMLGDSSILNNNAQLKFHCYRYFWKNGIDSNAIETRPLKSLQSSSLHTGTGFRAKLPIIDYKGYKMALIRPRTKLPALESQIAINGVILLDNPDVNIEGLAKTFQFEKVIAGAGSVPWHEKEWKKACRKAGYEFHSVPQEGALVENL